MRGYPLEIRLGQGVYQVSGLTVGYDAANSRGSQVTVSALRIVATQPGNIIERIPATSTEPILTINSGIAPITLEGLGLQSNAGTAVRAVKSGAQSGAQWKWRPREK